MIVKSFKNCWIRSAMLWMTVRMEQFSMMMHNAQVSIAMEDDDIHPDEPMAEMEFQELFGTSDSALDFDRF